MADQTPLLPLFPLEVVLFPGATLPLHIFEPRYKKMVAECLEKKTEFGVVLMHEDSMAEIGCTARITEVVKRYEDGRMDIITEGVRRFEIVYENREEDLLRGEVSFFDDEEEVAPLQLKPLVDAVQQVYSKIVLALSKPNTQVEMVKAEPPRLAFAVAQALGLPLDFSQKLLGLKSEASRLKELHQFLNELYPKIERLHLAQKKAGGNGHLT